VTAAANENGENNSKTNTKSAKKDSVKSINVISNYNLGDVVEGTVTGIVDFGIFVKINNEVEALIHKSEID